MAEKSKTVASELEAIRKKAGGVLRPGDVVEFAEDPASALHSRFEWNDGVAAHQHRLWQARTIIARVTIITNNNEPVQVRAYVSLKADRGKDGYRATVDVLRDEDRRAEMLEELCAELRQLRRKYASLKEIVSLDLTLKQLRAAMKTSAER